MPDFLLELLTEEIPARMQAKAAEQLRVRFDDGIRGQLPGGEIETFVTPRRLILHARGLGAEGSAQKEERRGPRADAPAQALEGFLRSTGLTRDQLEERDTPKGRFLYATIRTPGRSAAAVIAELVPQIVRDFDWPKSMRWGEASLSNASPRWVRPLSSIVALLDGEVVPFEAAGIASGRTTRGHRFMHREAIEIASAATYADQLRAAKVLIDPAERSRIILDGARAAATAHGLTLIEDAPLVAENAGLTEWPAPLLGQFDPAFLAVPREVSQLTMRTNQKYFALTDASGALAPAFVCVANLDAPDGGATILAGNRKVLAARLSDAKFFWDADRAVTLESRLPKLETIVFHEKLGTVADKVERVAKLARWLVESGAVGDPLRRSAPPPPEEGEEQNPPPLQGEVSSQVTEGARALADLAEQAARLCKADLVSATVGEFPEVQGIAGRYLALAEGLPVEVADAIRDHYKPVGQGDDVPTAPVSVAVALADKLDTLVGFFAIEERPTGSRDPFALRRAALGLLTLVQSNRLRVGLFSAVDQANLSQMAQTLDRFGRDSAISGLPEGETATSLMFSPQLDGSFEVSANSKRSHRAEGKIADEFLQFIARSHPESPWRAELLDFLGDRLKVQQRDLGIRPDILEAVFQLGTEDDVVRLLARVRALQTFIGTDEGANLLAGYKRAANILAIEAKRDGVVSFERGVAFDGRLGPHDQALAAAVLPATVAAEQAVAREDFPGAMTALAQLRQPVDAFFDAVMVNDPDSEVREMRLALLAKFRDAVNAVADFSRIEG